jgi:hypothetical protein
MGPEKYDETTAAIIALLKYVKLAMKRGEQGDVSVQPAQKYALLGNARPNDVVV